jgi:hypothetical protein
MPPRFEIIMIKPTHYDEEGYPITWWRALIPSNTLAVIYGINRDCAQRQVLGPDVEITLTAIDETNRVIRPERIIRGIRKRGSKAFVMLVGVQSNQYPRALDIAAPFREAGIPVAIGGFHVSGTLAMLPEPPPELREAWDMGISLFAGEAEEGRMDQVLIDAWNGELKPLYNFLNDLPHLPGQPTPFLLREAVDRTIGTFGSFDLGRGCPFQCSFCTIINVQGRKSRFRSADDLEKIIRENHAQGIKSFFITDDNMARNHDWEKFFDRLIALREEGLKANLMIQVDTLCHKTPGFIEKAIAAGTKRVFIGLENINPDNLAAAGKRQNKITEYRAMLQEWVRGGVYTFAGYILGFPNDTKESIVRDIEIIKRELPLDVLELFYLTPLPGSKDHLDMYTAGQWMDPDINKYTLHHRVTHHTTMSDEEWEAAYKAAWDTFYTYEHMETVARRHGFQKNSTPRKAAKYFNDFKMIFEIEGVHPLEGGVVRIKHRTSRRPSFRRESPLVFYPRYLAETAVKAFRFWTAFRKRNAIVKKVENDARRYEYTDVAVIPVEDEIGSLGLFQETRGGGDAVELERKRAERIKRVRETDAVPAE